MKRHDGLVICDLNKTRKVVDGQEIFDGVIVTDNVTIIPRSIQVRKGKVFEVISDDPNNQIFDHPVMKNRVVDEHGKNLLRFREIEIIADKNIEADFCSYEHYKEWKQNN